MYGRASRLKLSFASSPGPAPCFPSGTMERAPDPGAVVTDPYLDQAEAGLMQPGLAAGEAPCAAAPPPASTAAGAGAQAEMWRGRTMSMGAELFGRLHSKEGDAAASC